MKTIEINLYKFEELSEEAKEKAISKLCDINVNYDWWEFTFEDAKNIGLKITGFDLDRSRHCTGDFILSAFGVADKVIKEHGENTGTYKLSAQFIEDWNDLVSKYSDGINTDKVAEDNEHDFDNDADELEQEFLKDILEEYSIILQNEYEYLCSEDAITETIICNDYDFTEDGNIY